MTTPKKPDYISQEDWDAVDSPELTVEFVAGMRPAHEVAPELIEMQIRRGRPPVTRPKVATTLRLSQDVIDHFKAAGPGWQTRIDEALRDVVRKETRKKRA
jgi:uncharacterized protein (DUF4415 family)